MSPSAASLPIEIRAIVEHLDPAAKAKWLAIYQAKIDDGDDATAAIEAAWAAVNPELADILEAISLSSDASLVGAREILGLPATASRAAVQAAAVAGYVAHDPRKERMPMTTTSDPRQALADLAMKKFNDAQAAGRALTFDEALARAQAERPDLVRGAVDIVDVGQYRRTAPGAATPRQRVADASRQLADLATKRMGERKHPWEQAYTEVQREQPGLVDDVLHEYGHRR